MTTTPPASGKTRLLARLERETHVEFFSPGGPGGQHRNKNETGVRLTHLPTGLTAKGTEERSRSRNLTRAFERLAERVAERERPRKIRKATKPGRGAKERRLDEKRRTGERKAGRRPPAD